MEDICGREIKRSLVDWKLDPFRVQTSCAWQREDGFLASLFEGTCGKRGRFWQEAEAKPKPTRSAREAGQE
jgi:hypothetical protein